MMLCRCNEVVSPLAPCLGHPRGHCGRLRFIRIKPPSPPSGAHRFRVAIFLCLSLAGVADDLFEDGDYLVARGVDVGEEDVSPSSAFCHGVPIWVFVQIMATLRQSRTNLIGIGILPIEGERPALVRLDGIYAA